jgi:hypothetical protein
VRWLAETEPARSFVLERSLGYNPKEQRQETEEKKPQSGVQEAGGAGGHRGSQNGATNCGGQSPAPGASDPKENSNAGGRAWGVRAGRR